MDWMPFILAIEPDRRQASRIAAIVRGPLKADLLVAESAERAIEALTERWPDLILTSALLSPKDEAALADRLRELDASGHHVQTLVIPVFASAPGRLHSPVGLLRRLSGARVNDSEPAGCDPAVFAGQIAEYLEKASADRLAAAAAREQALEDQAQAVPAWKPEPILRPEPIPRLEPIFPPEPVFQPASATIYLASPPAPGAVAETNDDPGKNEQKRADERRQEIAFEDDPVEPVAARASGDFHVDAPNHVLIAESIDVAAFVKELSDSLLAAAPRARTRPPVEATPPTSFDPNAFEQAGEEPAALSDLEMALEGLGVARDDSEDDTELWMPLAEVVGRRRPLIEGEASHAAPADDDWLLPRSKATASDARPAAPVGKAAPVGRDDPAERIDARRKKRQQGGPVQIQDEWGFFNPQECGYAALLAKLDEVTAANGSPGKRRV